MYLRRTLYLLAPLTLLLHASIESEGLSQSSLTKCLQSKMEMEMERLVEALVLSFGEEKHPPVKPHWILVMHNSNFFYVVWLDSLQTNFLNI